MSAKLKQIKAEDTGMIDELSGVELAIAVADHVAAENKWKRWQNDFVITWDKPRRKGEANFGPQLCISRTNADACDFEFRPDRDVAQAWELIEELVSAGWEYEVLGCRHGGHECYLVPPGAETRALGVAAHGDTAPEAISRARLKAQGSKRDSNDDL